MNEVRNIVYEFDYLWWNTVMTHVKVDTVNEIIEITNYTDDMIYRAFGIREHVTMVDLQNFYLNRCFPKSRGNRDQLLHALGLDYYNPLAIIRKTHGSQFGDYAWIRFEGEDLEYDRDIKLRE